MAPNSQNMIPNFGRHPTFIKTANWHPAAGIGKKAAAAANFIPLEFPVRRKNEIRLWQQSLSTSGGHVFGIF